MPMRRNNAPALAVDRSVLVVHLTAEERATLDNLARTLRLEPEEIMRRGMHLVGAAGNALFGKTAPALAPGR